jgi:hypothetical protein
MPIYNIITKNSIDKLGYDFVKDEFLSKGKNEYYLRNQQERSGRKYKKLTKQEIEILEKNNNTHNNWNDFLVVENFNPNLVVNNNFFGLIRIGKLDSVTLSFSELTTPVGLYNSTIISCDIGDNVAINNVNYLSHYIIGNEVILINVNEIVTSNKAKFGNGVVKQGEDESHRVWLEVCNENAGRKILPYNGMQPGDAFLWSKYRDDKILLQKLTELTEKKFTTTRGFYGKIGNRTIIKNSKSIKDCWIGEDAYIKGVNKLKNLTINSGNSEGRTQIGEGCELVNGIIGFGCRIFYGVKAVRFITANHSQLKYGARLINSYLGYNSTISCCEVLNSLIYSFHEQHHNNSFLCAALVLGQSNLAAGSTIGSNHNSRGADGEIIAGRGFWPGLCVSLKHNSIFSSFTIIAKGDYNTELNIKIPFSLVSIDLSNDKLMIMPAYWFMYNMYALERNAWKYADRDKRNEKIHHLETHYLAPDTINEIINSITLLEELAGKSWHRKNNLKTTNTLVNIEKGKSLFQEKNIFCNNFEIEGGVFENSKRPTIILKAIEAYHTFKEIVQFYLSNVIIDFIEKKNLKSINPLLNSQQKSSKIEWLNIGGQLMLKDDVEILKKKIKNNKIKSWDAVHEFYQSSNEKYLDDKLEHALSCFQKISSTEKINKKVLSSLFDQSINTKKWMVKNIETSREKDYANEFRKMVYDNDEEMKQVLGNINDNSFIKEQKKQLKIFIDKVEQIKLKFKLN